VRRRYVRRLESGRHIRRLESRRHIRGLESWRHIPAPRLRLEFAPCAQ
jgi:hypothetical protein